MQVGEGMAPFAEARGGLVARREVSGSSFTHKRDRSDGGKGHSSDKAFRDNEGTGSKSRDNDGGKGGNGNGDGSKGDGNDNNHSSGGGNGNGNNSGSHGGGDSGSPPPGGEGIAGTPPTTTAIVVAPAPVTTTSIPTTSTFDPGSDSNGAQRLSSDPPLAGVTTTQIPPQTSTIVAPTTFATTSSPSSSSTSSILTTSTIAGTGPNAVVTSFIPVVTTSAVVESTTTITSIAIGQAGSFGTDFSGFSDLPKPTNKGDANDDSADRKHKDSSSSNSTSSATGKDTSKPKPLSPTAERALISVGSIGAFVTVCVLFWLVWRAMRKHKQKKNFSQGNISSFDTSDGPFATVSRFTSRTYGKVASKVPFLGKKGKAWRNLEETSSLTSARNIAPMSMTTNNLGPARVGRAGSPTDTSPIERADTLQTFGFDNASINNNSPPPSIPAQVYYSNGGLGIQFQQDPSLSPPQELDAGDVSPNGASGVANQSVSSFYSHSPTASRVPARVSAQNMAPAIHLQQVVHTRNSSSLSTITMKQPVALRPEQHQLLIQQQLAPSDTSVSSDTMRSRMPDPYYNQSQLARQPSDAYDPDRRQVNRASELSSLSSGFGDGEMLMLMPDQLNINKTETSNANTPGALPQPIAIPAEPMSSKGQFSWMRNTKRMTNSTVYSEASDDQPAKFRTVDSWVKQQTGRVRRGQASIDVTTDASAGEASGIKLMPGHEPGIPHPLPEEQRLTMMMDDEEVPRRPDTLLVKGIDQQVPPIPKQ